MDGREIEMSRLVDEGKREKIGNLFLTLQLQSWELNPVVEHFKGTVSYDETKLVRAYMQQKGS